MFYAHRMEFSRENRARSLEVQKLAGILDKVRSLDSYTGLQERGSIACVVDLTWSLLEIEFQSSGRDVSTVASLINSGNDIIDKCAMTFASLSVEIDLLVHEARTKFYDAILLYGEESKVFHREKHVFKRPKVLTMRRVLF